MSSSASETAVSSSSNNSTVELDLKISGTVNSGPRKPSKCSELFHDAVAMEGEMFLTLTDLWIHVESLHHRSSP